MTWQYSKEGWVKPEGKFFPSLWPISVWAHILTGSGDAREFVARRVSGVGWFLCQLYSVLCCSIGPTAFYQPILGVVKMLSLSLSQLSFSHDAVPGTATGNVPGPGGHHPGGAQHPPELSSSSRGSAGPGVQGHHWGAGAGGQGGGVHCHWGRDLWHRHISFFS